MKISGQLSTDCVFYDRNFCLLLNIMLLSFFMHFKHSMLCKGIIPDILIKC